MGLLYSSPPHLFLLSPPLTSHPLTLPRWAAQYIQPSLPLTDLEETSFDNPFLDHLITILATVLLPVKARASFLHEFRVHSRYMCEGEEEEQDRVWCVLDGEGSEEEDLEEARAGLRESDLITLVNQIPVDAMFRCRL